MPLTSYAYMVRQTGLSGFKFLSTWGMVTMYKNKEKQCVFAVYIRNGKHACVQGL